MQIGVMIPVRKNTNIRVELEKVRDMGLQSCQFSMWDPTMYTDELAEQINQAVAETGVIISTFWAGYSGPVEWNFTYGPLTAGLVPQAYRGIREKELLAGSAFAEKIHVKQVATHVGFLPENYFDPDFRGTVASLKKICQVMKERGQIFLFETGQETPVTVLRAIEEIGLDNVGINFDTANLMLYGKGNAADQLHAGTASVGVDLQIGAAVLARTNAVEILQRQIAGCQLGGGEQKKKAEALQRQAAVWHQRAAQQGCCRCDDQQKNGALGRGIRP
jgi:sugar phosphate isomerase/epimerase